MSEAEGKLWAASDKIQRTGKWEIDSEKKEETEEGGKAANGTLEGKNLNLSVIVSVAARGAAGVSWKAQRRHQWHTFVVMWTHAHDDRRHRERRKHTD